LKDGGGASGAHQRGGLAAAVAPDSFLSAVDSTDDVDKRLCGAQGRWQRGSPWLVSHG
jgi:hypothetical protein